MRFRVHSGVWVGVLVVLSMRPARADARETIESPFIVSGFVGIDYFGDNIQLGNSWAPEQIPGTSVLLGARLQYVALPELTTLGAARVSLAGEAELGIAPSFTGDFDNKRMSYFAPVFQWTAHAMLRVDRLPARTQAHLLVGGGGATITSTSPFMSKETDPVAYWGLGASMPVSDRWSFRLDVRHGIMPSRDGTVTSTLAVQLGAGANFDLPQRKRATTEAALVEPKQPEVDDTDTDADGLPDWIDACPKLAESVNGADDQDGCPEADPDGDGLTGATDKCPDQAEDLDHFQDDDGCPEPDNDRDAILDGRDACAGEPETRNGFDDTDGCPDTIPAELVRVLTDASSITFEPTRARVTDKAKKALTPLVTWLNQHGDLRLAIIAHPALKPNAAAADLARRRADAIKWYLVDQGLVADRFLTQVGAANRTPVELTLVIPPTTTP